MYGNRFRFKRKAKKFRRFKRFNRKKGYKRKDYTPVVKLEAYYIVRTSNTANTSSLNFDINGLGDTTGKEGKIPYTDMLDVNGTWGKYKDFYTQYMITGASAEFCITKDGNYLDSIYNVQPIIACVNYPAYDFSYVPTPQEVRQMDNSYVIPPKINGVSRYYQRYPRNYLPTNLSKVGIGVWNTITNSNNQNGIFTMQILNNASSASTKVNFAYLKFCLYVRFGGKKI